MEASKEPFFYKKLADVNYGTLGLDELLFILQISEKGEGKDQSVEIIENPRGSRIENLDDMMNTFLRNDEIHHAAGNSDGGNSVTILNRFLNGDVQHVAVPLDPDKKNNDYQNRELGYPRK